MDEQRAADSLADEWLATLSAVGWTEAAASIRRRHSAPCGETTQVEQDWLSARGLLNRVPEYREGVTNDAQFTYQVEGLCGPRAKGAFQSQFGFHAVSPDWVKRNLNPPDKGGEVLSCLMNVATVAGFKFGFIGNEYYQR